MEATTVSVGRAMLDGALGYAKTKAAKEIVLQLGIERDSDFITDELQMMQSFLMTADEEQSQNKVLMTWVKQIGDLAYNVEDSLMDFSLHSEKKPFLGCIPRSPCDRRRIAMEVKELRAKVEDVSSRNLRYRLIKENSGSKPAVAEDQANIASAAMFGINEARVAALEKEKLEVDLHQLIASNDVDLRVIAVWGTAGDLGKTTAIQEVYDNPEVVSNFGLRAWVRLACPFNPKDFLHSIVRQFYENFPEKLGEARKWKTVGSNVLMNMEDMTQSMITNEFDTQVNYSRYLIVIDNLSTLSEWSCIKRFFPDNKKRSRIIISTQQAELASLCTKQPYQVSELNQLSSDQTLYLFHKKNNSEEQVSMAGVGAALFDINEPKLATAQKEKLKVSLRQLISDEVKDLRVIVVKETDGDLGNLSVIKEVYDDPSVSANFGICAWVTLTRPFNPKEFIQGLVRQFTTSFPDELEDGEEITSFRDNNVLIKMEKRKQRDLVRVFDAQVRDNSFLFVINDLSTVEEWDCIKKFFLDYKMRSRIIVSTYQVEIASLCTEQIYRVLEIKQLSSDQTLPTFHNKVMHESCSAESISDSNKVTTTEKNIAIPTSGMQEDQQPKSVGEDKVCNSTARKKFYRSRTLALADEMFTGRETEKSIVIKLVCQPENNEGCKVISVWGMGGLGKTTLVRSVYRSQELSSLKRAWATAMRPFNPKVLLRDIALQLQKSIQEDPAGATATGAQTKSIASMKLFELKEELSRLLNTQKCLIVLDDISSTFEWELVKRSLDDAGTIIVTTREKNIAEHCSREYNNMYSLEGLKEDAALELFKKKVFKDNTDLVPVMMEQARLILKKCHGLPLAISTIGGFLATKPTTAIEWRKMNDHISAELEINPELRTMKTVLMRSYEGLPYRLKSAFLYLSVFREGRIIRRNRLVKRWIAEGYSREMHGMTAWEVGENYFDELLDRSMILPAEGVDYFNEKIDACQLHDIIHEICISKAREENLVFTLEEGYGVSSTQGAIRHLVVGSNWKRDKEVLETVLDLSHVRSLTVFGEWEPFLISDNMRYLRVLDLEGTLGLRDHHLDKIGQLLHLKYLSLRGCRNIYYLPNSLGNLRHLQTLDVRGTRIFELPTTITKLWKLQHLRTTDDYLKTRDNLMGEHDIIGKYASCVTTSANSYALMVQTGPLFWRPQVLDDGLNRHDMWNMYRFLMVCLEEKGTIYGWLEGVEAPRGIGKLKALHTLDLVNVARGKGKATLKELEGLTQLYKLGVAGISNENSKQFWSAIASHNQLRSLSVQGYPWRELDGCLGEGLSPPNCLQSLKLYGELVRLTEWIHQLQNLSKLILAYTHLEQDDAIQTLGVLPNLVILRLMWGSFVGNQLHFQGPSFPNLMVLELNGLTDVKSVFFGEHTMPKLELLQADWCWSLKEISWLPLLTSLKGVRLGYQISQELKAQVQSQVAEHRKPVSLDTNYVSSFSME